MNLMMMMMVMMKNENSLTRLSVESSESFQKKFSIEKNERIN